MNTENKTTLVVTNPQEQNAVAPTRAYEKLSIAEQEKVNTLMAKLADYSDTALIEFSSDTAANSAREAEDFLKHTKLNDLEEFNESMGSLRKSLRSIDTKELSKQDPSPLSRIPLIGKALAESAIGKKIESVIERQETIKKSIDLTIQTIEGIKLTLREDLLRCARTRALTVEFAKNLEYEYIALYKKKLELEKTYQEFISSTDYDEANLDHSEYINKLQTGIQNIERKMDDVLRLRVNAIQDIPSFSLVSNAENALINSIDDCIKNVVPEWNKAFLKAILAYRVQNAADVLKSTKEATNQILIKSSQMTANAIVSAAEVIESPQIASETLEKKTEIFLSSIDKIVQISIDASKKRAEDAVRLKELERESIVQSSQRRTVPIISEGTGGANLNE